jgi:hypothetical protein
MNVTMWGTLYTFDNQIFGCQRDEMGRTRNMNAYRILVGKPERKRPLGRQRHRWVNNIKMDLREIGWGGTGWIDLAQDRDQGNGSCEHCNELFGLIKCWEILEWLQNWRFLKKGSSPWS